MGTEAMKELIYRLAYLWHYWRATRFPLRTCIDAAWAFDMADMAGYSPSESVSEEIYYMGQDADRWAP